MNSPPPTVELCARLREGYPCLGVVYRPQPDVAICGRCGDRAGGAMYRRVEATASKAASTAQTTTDSAHASATTSSTHSVHAIAEAMRDDHSSAYEIFYSSLRAHPCSDCGVQYPPPVMQFDHRPGTKKLFHIAMFNARKCTREKLLAEIAKCDLVCANCHAIRTQRRGRRAEPVQHDRRLNRLDLEPDGP